MTHEVETNNKIEDRDGSRANALKRLHIAPLFFTKNFPKGSNKGEKKEENKLTEGDNYYWPDLTDEGYTLTIRQPPLDKKRPKKGIIGSAVLSALNASGYVPNRKVPSAPGNHAKIMIVDDELYVVGSGNLYPGFLSEFNYLIEGEAAVNELLKSYWNHLWDYSKPHDVNRGGKRVE